MGSILNYCVTILYEAGKQEVEKLQLGQNAAMRYILGWGRESRIIDMLEKLGWLCMEMWIKYRVFILIYKIKMGVIREVGEEVEKLWEKKHNKDTRKGEGGGILQIKGLWLK